MFDVSPDDKSHPKWVIRVQRSGGHQPSGHRDVVSRAWSPQAPHFQAWSNLIHLQNMPYKYSHFFFLCDLMCKSLESTALKLVFWVHIEI